MKTLIAWHRIVAIIYRHFFDIYRDVGRLSMLFYWPALDLILWGLAGSWIQMQYGDQTRTHSLFVSAVVFWQVVIRANFDVALSFLEELYHNSLTSLFATPLKLSEWILAIIILGLIMGGISFCYAFFLVYVLYDINLLHFGFYLIPITSALFISGLALGFLSTIVLVSRGIRFQSLGYMIGWLFVTLSGVFYPVEVLSPFFQYLAYCLPMSYLFESLRILILSNTFPWTLYLIGLILALFYLTMILIGFKYAFEKSKIKGFARLSF